MAFVGVALTRFPERLGAKAAHTRGVGRTFLDNLGNEAVMASNLRAKGSRVDISNRACCCCSLPNVRHFCHVTRRELSPRIPSFHAINFCLRSHLFGFNFLELNAQRALIFNFSLHSLIFGLSSILRVTVLNCMDVVFLIILIVLFLYI